jgi:signal transduction histidine kinase
VTDTGNGVAPQDLPHVFARYYRGGDRPRASGAGLGLAIARRIVELHGQEITLQSTLGAGTRIEFGLPLPSAAVISYLRAATAA